MELQLPFQHLITAARSGSSKETLLLLSFSKNFNSSIPPLTTIMRLEFCHYLLIPTLNTFCVLRKKTYKTYLFTQYPVLETTDIPSTDPNGLPESLMMKYLKCFQPLIQPNPMAMMKFQLES